MLPIFLYPLALVGLVGVPLLVGIYLLRNRFRRQPVSSLMLWLDPREAREGGSRIRRLQTPWLFLLELLAILLLVLAAVEPMIRWHTSTRPLVVVLDDSFSMLAGGDDSPRRQAIRALLDDIRNRPPWSVRFVLAGERPQLLGETLHEPAEVEAALAGWRCRAATARLGEAITLAADVGGELALLLVLTDQAPPENTVPEKGRIQWWAFGSPRPNLAFVNAARTSRDGADRCLLEVCNLSDQPGSTALTLSAGGELLQRSRLTLKPGETRRIVLQLKPDTPAVRARLDDDALPLDNEVYLLPVTPRPVRVEARVGNKELREPLLKALKAVRSVNLTTTAPELIFVDGDDLVETNAWVVRLFAEKEAAAYTGPFVLDRSHPVTDGLSLRGVIWGAGKTEELAGTPVILAGNVVLLTDAETQADSQPRHELRLRVRPELSTLPESPDWPILIWNIVNWRASQGLGLARPNVRLGETISATFPTQREQVRLLAPGQDAKTIPIKGRQLVFKPEEVGLHEIQVEDTTYPFAVNTLSRDESDLQNCVSDRWGNWLDDTSLRLEYRGISWAVLLLLLAVFTLHLILVARQGRAGL
jgi:hypothetical protein